MDKKINDINEMIDHNQEDDDDVKDRNNHCSSNRSTPTSEKEKNNQHDDDDDAENEDVAESRDNGDRCSVNSSSVNNNSVGTRTMAEELALKDKEVRTPKHLRISIPVNYSPVLLFVRCTNFHPRTRDVLSCLRQEEICENPSRVGKQFILQTRNSDPGKILRRWLGRCLKLSFPSQEKK